MLFRRMIHFTMPASFYLWYKQIHWIRIPSSFNCTHYCTEVQNTQWPERILSGIQPTGVLHLGNYLGAIQNWVHMQNTYENVIFSVADLHSMTSRYDFKKLPENVLLMTASLIACGIDPQKSAVFLQSKIPEHTQLCWVLGCFCTSARLARLPQYREKLGNLEDTPLGLYIYPILQTADILLYKTTKVPVGIDQIQHLQLCRELARKLNSIFGEIFPVPEAIVIDGPSKVKNLRDPSKKMSKSFPDQRSRIEITDTSDEIRLKFKKAVTDCTSKVAFDPINRPGVSNIIMIHSAITKQSIDKICEDADNLDTGQFKMIVADIVVEFLKPIREEVNRLSCDKDYLMKVLREGTAKVSPIAAETWQTVKEKTGLTLSSIQ